MWSPILIVMLPVALAGTVTTTVPFLKSTTLNPSFGIAGDTTILSDAFAGMYLSLPLYVTLTSYSPTGIPTITT